MLKICDAYEQFEENVITCPENPLSHVKNNALLDEGSEVKSKLIGIEMKLNQI